MNNKITIGSIARLSLRTTRVPVGIALSVLTLGFTPIALAQIENSPAGSVFVEGRICVSSDSNCAAGEPFAGGTDLEVKSSVPVLYFENTTSGSPDDSVEWYFQTDINRFRLIDHGDGGNRVVEILGIEAGAPENALRLKSDGKIGLGTSTPAKDLHILRDGFPAIRIQNESQAWDIEGDQFSYAIFDATNNTRPFQITPAAPDKSIVVTPTGNVGFGTDTPAKSLHVYEQFLPVIRMQSDTQTWDIEGDGASFAIYDAIAAKRPFQIIPGAPGASLHITAAGNIGFGTETPEQAVDVMRSAAAARFQLTSYTNVAAEAPQYIQRRARGTLLAPAALLNGDNLGLFSFRGYNGTTMGGSRATITAQAAGNFTGASTPTRLIFATTPIGQTAPVQVMEITHDGKVRVNGTALNVPDYVFEDDYDLMPLEELRSFIDQHGHLPGIASADEVTAEGLDLAGSQMGQLQKIEELTLYTLQQEQRLAAQDAELAALRERVADLDSMERKLADLEAIVRGQ